MAPDTEESFVIINRLDAAKSEVLVRLLQGNSDNLWHNGIKGLTIRGFDWRGEMPTRPENHGAFDFHIVPHIEKGADMSRVEGAMRVLSQNISAITSDAPLVEEAVVLDVRVTPVPDLRGKIRAHALH